MTDPNELLQANLSSVGQHGHHEKKGSRTSDTPHTTMVASQEDLTDPEPVSEPMDTVLLSPSLRGKGTITDQSTLLAVSRPRARIQSQHQTHRRRLIVKSKLCLFCGHQSRDFATVSSLIRHHRNTYFRFVTGELHCPRENCPKAIHHPDAFARHASKAHGADMGKRASLVDTKTAGKPRQHTVVFA